MLKRICDRNDFGRFARLLIVETATFGGLQELPHLHR
jgi:hypothetical protein